MEAALVLVVQPTTDSDLVPISGFVEGRPDLGVFEGSLSGTESAGVLTSIFGPAAVPLLEVLVDASSDSPSAGEAINLGPDFPLTDEARERREKLVAELENALHEVRSDPLWGNVWHCVNRCLMVAEGKA